MAAVAADNDASFNERALELEEIGPDVFLSVDLWQPRGNRGVFGGQVIGQALTAAAKTVASPFRCNSLHCYFLAAGVNTDMIAYEVKRVRQGTSFCSRLVVAKQHGRVIFAATISFQRPEPSALQHQYAMPEVPPPEGLATREEYMRQQQQLVSKKLADTDEEKILEYSRLPVEMRPVPTPADRRGLPTQMVWLRAKGNMSELGHLHHQSMLAYASDFVLISTALKPFRMDQKDARYKLKMLVSLDHTIWFHEPFKADEWLLYVMETQRIRLLCARQGRRLVASGHRRGLQTLSVDRPHEAANEDDVVLRDLFDLPSQTTLGSEWFHRGQPTGLLMEARFISPKSFRQAGIEAVAEAKALTEQVLSAQTPQEKRNVVKCLDQLSDALCRVMDVAELVRQVHPDSSWQKAAEDVYAGMFDYMNGLNTHVGLYTKLVEVMDDPGISKALSPVEHEVALSFRRDFERSGIHLESSAHESFVKLSASIHDLSRDFLRHQSDLPPKTGAVPVPAEALYSLPSQAVMEIFQSSRSYKRASDGVTMVDVVPGDMAAHYILRDCKDEGVREAVYKAWQSGSSATVRPLEQLLEDRLQLARTVGFESFSHLTLDDKMAKSPDHVDEFLRGLATQARPQWDGIARSLRETRRRYGKGAGDASADMRPWDRDFWITKQRMERGLVPSMSPYFSLGRVVLGLSRVFKSLYGVELRAATPQPGEIWHPEVRKLEVVDEDGALLGLVYCDVFSRSSKAHVGAAHFTARCARRVDDDIGVPGMAAEYSSMTVVERGGQRFQLPVVVLICNFPPPETGSPPLLSWDNVETIFHEMGHAMHSMLGQNGFHNVAGTRCPVDFVELPSVLMEHFARSPNVLSLFASHYKTGEPLPRELIYQCAEQRQHYAALDLHSQLFMSALDQRYHSAVLGPSGDSSPGWSTRALANVHGDPMFSSGSGRTLFEYVKGTRWQSRFTHLIGYGASYYSYLFDRVLAGQIWDRVFQGDRPHPQDCSNNPLTREAGERYKNEVLRWGGGRSPWQCLASVLDNGRTPHREIEDIAQGSRSAMRIVGTWRLPDM
ncbi:Mitochondrial intermediate peptidase [Coemansia sp. RSA 552]|nr:Mitochondrial intermediate peptidase [Coemansia sp. RSA 552]